MEDPRATRPYFGAQLRYSCVNGGLLYLLVQCREASRRY